MKLLSTLLILGTVFIASSHCDKVPVFLWGTKTTIHTPALKTHDSENFDNYLRKQQSEDAVTVVFYENNLSTQDLTHCKNADGTTCFQYLNSIKSSSYLPSVENPIDTLERYHEGNQLSIHLNIDGSFNNNFDDIEKGDIVFAALTDNQANEDSTEQFTRHDGVIRKFMEQLTSKFEVVGVYTGNHAPVVHSLHKREVNEKTDVSKSLPKPEETNNLSKPEASKNVAKQAEVPQGIVLSNDRVLIYFTRLYYTNADNVPQNVTFNGGLVLGADSNNKSIHITMTGTDSESFYFQINERGNTYNIENVTFNAQRMRHEQISVNLPFSFHCGPGVVFRSKQSSMVVVWEGLQIEPQFYRTSFNGSYFSESWDCVGFTSPGVWMGIVITFLLLGILSCGFSWMFDIKTMDRFDDPKGKTITITEME